MLFAWAYPIIASHLPSPAPQAKAKALDAAAEAEAATYLRAAEARVAAGRAAALPRAIPVTHFCLSHTRAHTTKYYM